jgi:hypothetical protein
VQARGLEQLIDELQQPGSLAFHTFQELHLHLPVVGVFGLSEGLGDADDRGERRAQLV